MRYSTTLFKPGSVTFTHSRRRAALEFAPLIFTVVVLVLLGFCVSGPIPLRTTKIYYLSLGNSGAEVTNPAGVWLGLQGSCWRTRPGASLDCMPTSFSPNFNGTWEHFFQLGVDPLLRTLPDESLQLPAVLFSSEILHAAALVSLFFALVVAHIRPNDAPIPFFGRHPRACLWTGAALQAIAFFLLLTGSLSLQKQMGDFIDGYNAAVPLVPTQPPFDVATAGPVFAMLFTATAFSAVTLLCGSISYLSFTPREEVDSPNPWAKGW